MRELSRRMFIAGALGAAGATVAGLAACSPTDLPSTKTVGTSGQSITPTETKDCEIVIVGGGISGLAAAVEAGQKGAQVILLESRSFGGFGVEGVFATESDLQKKKGIVITPNQILADEIKYTQNRANALLWMDLINASTENYNWLVENGVKFSGVVDDYGGGGPETMHWFEGFASDAYVPAMIEAAKAAGVEILEGHAGKQLVMDGDIVTGVYALREDGSYVQINAGAVILATGGFANNVDLIARRGYNMDYLRSIAAPGHDGDGYYMAMQAGAADNIGDSCELSQNTIVGIEDRSQLYYYFFHGGPYLWINENGERFSSEDATSQNFMAGTMPMKNQKCTYTIFTRSIFETMCDKMGFDEAPAQLDKLVSENVHSNIYECDTVEEVADAFGLNKENVLSAIERYNQMCASGADTDYGKDPSFLVPLEEGPFYIARLEQDFVASIGGIMTNRNMEAIRFDKSSIAGLYAIGVDGCMLYRDVYTINIPATCCGNNVNSGRVAARNAIAYLVAR